MSEYPHILRLSADYSIKPFDCGNADLNDFLSEKDNNDDTRLMYFDLKTIIPDEMAASYGV